MKKTLKNFNLLLVAVMALFIGVRTVNAERVQTPQTFTFDYQFHLRLGELVDNKNTTYSVPIIAYETTDFNKELTLTGDEIHYKVTEISETEYNTLKAYQDQIDASPKDKATLDNYYYSDDDANQVNNNVPSYIIEYMDAIRNGEDVDQNPWWCYNNYKTGDITLQADCETKYYIVTIDGFDNETEIMEGVNWNYHTARVYKVDANKNQDKCEPTIVPDEPKEDTTPEDNPKTGTVNPYIICGAIATVGVVVFVTNKKKKYI